MYYSSGYYKTGGDSFSVDVQGAGTFWRTVFLMDHGESFFGHTYHQEALLWQHDVALFDFSSEHVTFYLLHRRHGAKVQIVTAEKKMWNVPAYVHQDASVKDDFSLTSSGRHLPVI